MSRPLRLQFENAVYHVISRGNHQENVFSGERDRGVFLKKADQISKKYSVICFAYCLMGSHFHLFLKTPLANLSQFIHCLNSAYANWHRVRYGTRGPLFQDRFKSILVDTDSYATELSAYIHLNPVRAGIVDNPLDSSWSSYRVYYGLSASPIRNLDPGFILSYFGGSSEEAQTEYHRFVMDRIQMKDPTAWMPPELKGSILGSPEFIAGIHSRIAGSGGHQREIPQTRPPAVRLIGCADILELLSSVFEIRPEAILSKRKNNLFRQLLICLLKKNAGCSLKSIGEFVGLDYVAVAMAAKRFEMRMRHDAAARACFRRAESEIDKLRLARGNGGGDKTIERQNSGRGRVGAV